MCSPTHMPPHIHRRFRCCSLGIRCSLSLRRTREVFPRRSTACKSPKLKKSGHKSFVDLEVSSAGPYMRKGFDAAALMKINLTIVWMASILTVEYFSSKNKIKKKFRLEKLSSKNWCALKVRKNSLFEPFADRSKQTR